MAETAALTQSQSPFKYYLDENTYITKRNGEMVMVRERERKTSVFEVGLKLLDEVFRGSNYHNDTEKESTNTFESDQEGKYSSSPQRSSTPTSFTISQQVILPSSSSVSAPSMTGRSEDQQRTPAGIYQSGGKQLALLPTSTGQNQLAQQEETRRQHQSHGTFINPWGFQQAMPQHLMAPAYQQALVAQQQALGLPVPWPQVIHMVGGQHVCGGMCANDPTTTNQVASAEYIARQQPHCAGCGRVRSRKFQHENPVKQGEVPTPSYCRKCARYDTSSVESESERKKSYERKSKKSSRKSRKKEKSKDKVH